MSGKKREGSFMVRGSIYTMRGKCGKDNCRCKRGELHETPALSYSLKGKTNVVYLRPEQVQEVGEAIERYKRARENLESQALAGIEALRRQARGGKGRRGRHAR